MAHLAVETTDKDNEISEKQCQIMMQNVSYTATVIESRDYLVQDIQEKSRRKRSLDCIFLDEYFLSR